MLAVDGVFGDWPFFFPSFFVDLPDARDYAESLLLIAQGHEASTLIPTLPIGKLRLREITELTQNRYFLHGGSWVKIQLSLILNSVFFPPCCYCSLCLVAVTRAQGEGRCLCPLCIAFVLSGRDTALVPGQRSAGWPPACHTSQFHSGSPTDRPREVSPWYTGSVCISATFSKNNNQMQFNSHCVHIRNPFQGKSGDALWFSVRWMTPLFPGLILELQEEIPSRLILELYLWIRSQEECRYNSGL